MVYFPIYREKDYYYINVSFCNITRERGIFLFNNILIGILEVYSLIYIL